MKFFASILQTSFSESTLSLGQLLINQTNKRPTEEDQEVTGKSRKRAKLYYVEHPEDEPTCSKYVDRLVGSSGQHDSDYEDITIARAYAASENDEEDSVSILDQDQVCHDVQSFFSQNRQEMIKLISNMTPFQTTYVRILKKNRKREFFLPMINWLK